MRAYAIAIVFLSALHTYFSIQKGNSPLSLEFLLLLFSPLLFLAWKDIQNIKFGKDGLEIERLREISFIAEWWSGRSPTHGDWNWGM